jgi:hypothetical protein
MCLNRVVEFIAQGKAPDGYGRFARSNIFEANTTGYKPKNVRITVGFQQINIYSFFNREKLAKLCRN